MINSYQAKSVGRNLLFTTFEFNLHKTRNMQLYLCIV